MSNVTYFKLFREHFRYGFQRPKTDVCDFCTEMKEKLPRDPNDRCKISLEVHERKVRKRSTLKKDFISKARNDDETTHLVTEFDYGQNYPRA